MGAGKLLHQVGLTHTASLQTLVENRRIYNLNNCEMNVFETYEQAHRIPLTFNDFVITSMIRGKKIMHLFDQPGFEYVPGQSVIVPANHTMVIDFPDAASGTPTQCIALAVEEHYINNTLHFLNQEYNTVKDDEHEWKLQFNQYHFDNDDEVADLINKLMRVCRSSHMAKNIFADLALKELVIRMVQSQHLKQVYTETALNPNRSRLHYILDYIREHLTEPIQIDQLSRKAYLNRNIFFKSFKEQFGITPLEYINRERLRIAKQLLSDPGNSIKNISLQCGFSDVNYFVRLFKKKEGITPGDYQAACMHGQ